MADHVLSTLANFVSGKLSSLISDGTMPILNLLGELGRLQDTFSKVNAELFVALEKTELSRSEEDLVRKLKNVLYEADDILDSLAMEDQWPESVACNELPKYACLFLSRMKHIFQIMKIRGSLDSIEKLSRIHIVPEKGRSRMPDVLINREDAAVEHEEHVIGREMEAAAVAKLLLDSDNASNVSTVAITGMGGVGKTTVARSVFNNPEVEAQFDKKIWVCVSDERVNKVIVQKIIQSAGENTQVDGMEPLRQRLEQLIGGKRYLLVLDDVWNENRESWDKLKALLPRGAKGSKILLTTRSQRVGDASGANHSWPLKGLSEDDGWDLFEKKAFRQNQEVTKDPERVAIGKQVVQRCAGVPLAIKAMGALLSTKTNVEWQQFKDKELSMITQGTEGDIFPILKLSYYDLEPSLKQCFAYCSLFPKDYYIEREKLIRLWIAQGFIQGSDRNQDLEDIGNHYFTQLLWKSFFQEPEEDSLGNIKVVKMHDLMHDLATLVAQFECAYLNSSNANQTLKDTRHMSLHDASILCGLQPALFEPNKIRTILLNQIGCDDYCEEAVLNKFMSSFGHLRVLDLHGLKLKAVPNFIGGMKHLRYLDLSSNEFLSLPSFITTLPNLQTLNLAFNRQLRELPHDLKNLKNLKHLVLDRCDGLTYMPCGIGELTCLRTLSKCVVGSAEMSDGSTDMSCGIGGLSRERDTSKCRAHITELTSLNNLRGALEIKNSRNVRSVLKPDILKDKKGLEILMINFGEWSEDDIGLLEEVGDNSSGLVEETWGDSGLLEGALQLPNLKELELRNYNDKETVRNLSFMLPNLIELAIHKSKCKYFPDISHLTNLKTIDLDGLTLLTFLPSITRLSCLELISIKGLDSLEQIPTLHGLHHLKSIHFFDLPTLQSLPPLHELPSLKSLELVQLKSVEYIQDWEECYDYIGNCCITSCSPDSKSPAKAPSPLFFPSLKRLKLLDMPNLKRWWKQSSSSSSLVTHHHPPSSLFSRLESIYIEHMGYLQQIPTLHGLHHLKYISFKDLPALQSLPPLHELPSLESLELVQLKSVEYIQDWEECYDYSENCCITSCSPDSKSPAKAPSPLFFPSLKTLVLLNMPNLKRWWKQSSSSSSLVTHHHPPSSFFSRLESISIGRMQSLQQIPTLHGLHHLKSIHFFYLPTLQSLPPLHELPSLKNLELVQLKSVEYIQDWEECYDYSGNCCITSCSPDSKSPAKAPSPLFFPSFKRLILANMPNLKRWWKQSSSSSSLVTHHHPPSSFFSCLESISIGRMESLQQIPTLHGLRHLKSIHLSDLPTLQSLPPLHELPSLESLILKELKSVEYIQDWEECYDYSGNCCITCCSPDSNSKSPAKASSPLFFPSLKTLILVNMPNLKGWWKQSSSSSLVTHLHPPPHDDDDDVPPPPPHFPILSCLNILDCPNLISVPLFPYVESLEMRFCSKEILKQHEEYYMMNNWIINSKNNESSSSSSSVSASLSSSSPFSKLVELTVDPVVEDVPEGLLQHFTSLKKIQITSRFYPDSYSRRLWKNPILRGTTPQLEINGNLKFLPHWITEFTSLRRLRFRFLNETVLPKGLDLLTSLKSLELLSCNKLTALPKTMTAWASSLQQLSIVDCPKLESLPHWLSQLTSLQELSIIGCRKLEERCSRVNEGADWPNIAHIPFILINGRTIQHTRRR